MKVPVVARRSEINENGHVCIIVKPMESLWASVRLPLLIPVLMLAYECRTAVVAAFGAVQGLFAAAPEPVAEPAKRGLFALFGR